MAAKRAGAASGPRLVNESAIGVFVFTWISAALDGARVTVMWAEGLDGPQAYYQRAEDTRPMPAMAIRAPERFGWRGAPRSLDSFRAFAQAYAQATEAE